MRVLAIDPGNEESAFVIWNDGNIVARGKFPNDSCMGMLMTNAAQCEVVIEMVACYGMAVGKTVFDTVRWIGRFEQIAFERSPRVTLVYRKDIKMHHCHSMKANDSNIRQALIDRFEPGLPPKHRPAGKLKGISKDEWSALAIAVWYSDMRQICDKICDKTGGSR